MRVLTKDMRRPPPHPTPATPHPQAGDLVLKCGQKEHEMVAAGMSDREEGMGEGGMRFRREKSRLLYAHTRTRTHVHAHAPFQALSSARTQGGLQRQGRPVSAGRKPRSHPLKKQETERKDIWKERKDKAERSG